MFERIKRLIERRSGSRTEPVGATLFTATSLPTSSVPAPEEPLFASAPAAQTREPDLWDDEPLVGPPDPADDVDDTGFDEGFDDRGLGDTDDAQGEEDVTVEALTEELSRLAADEAPSGDIAVQDDDPAPAPEPLFPPRESRRTEPASATTEIMRVGRVEPREYDHVNVHGERLDVRPGPIRMTPSEALALAKDGPAALRRRRRG